MSREIMIKSLNNFILQIPLYLSIDNQKCIGLYTSLCTIRNQLIENNIIDKNLRHRMCFYKKVENNYVKIKEGDILEGTIFLNIEEEIDYSEPCNIMYHLEERISDFEKIFKEKYKKISSNMNDNIDIINIQEYIEIKTLWNEFKEKNGDSIDYAEWYFVIKPNKDEIPLLNKISLDIRKWYLQKEKMIYELDIIYIDNISNDKIYKFDDSNYSLIEKFLYDV